MDRTSSHIHAEILGKIERDIDLLALPEAVVKIIELSASEDVNMETMADIISTEPALAGRLLKIANSPFYGLSSRVNSIHKAMMVLGMTTVKCLALSAAIFDPEKLSDDIKIDIKALYGNIISVATTCRKLAELCKFSAPEEAFLCGLLHDIGTLYLIHHYPKEYQNVLVRAGQSGSVIDEENNRFGGSHPWIGSMIAQKWHLPANIVSAIANHDSCRDGDTGTLDDIVRLAVALNRNNNPVSDQYIEDKITKLSVIPDRLGIKIEHLDEISTSIMKDAIKFAELIEVDIGDFETILTRANEEIFNTYLSIQKLFKERRELTSRILEEERERALLEARQVAVSTLSHYINNASMQVSGQAQVIRLYLNSKSPDEIVALMPRILDSIDEAVRKTVAVLEEISDLNIHDNVKYFEKSKIMNIDERIKQRMERLAKDKHGIVLPKEAESARLK